MDISPDTTPDEPTRNLFVASSVHTTPILIVTMVSPNSPADQAGIRSDDEILEFGSINHDNFKELKQVSELVMHRQNQSINLKVNRQGRNIDITLIPKTWSGRGLLGCNIVIPTSTQ